MALNGNTLGSEISAAVNAISIPEDEAVSDANRELVWKAVANEIVNHFKANAQVSTTGSAVGVTAGGATVPTSSTGTLS